MTKVNLYKVSYDESLAQSVPKETPEFQDVIKESTIVGHIVMANSLREALDKAEAQQLKYFKVFNVELKEQQVNVM